jgi:tetratricopeptide (TPR) repeat protein
MKSKVILIVGALLIALAIGLIYFFNLTPSSSKLAVNSIDEKGIFIGDGKSGLESASDEAKEFASTVKALNQGWDNIDLGNSYDNAGQYEKAATAYKKAYDADPGNRIFSGRKLIETYEKLSRYDEAITVVDEILKNEQLVDYGIEKYTNIRNRLLAARNQTTAQSNT